jgi:hypothetical protein
MSEAAFILREAVEDGAESEDIERVSLPATADKYLVDLQHFSRLSGELTSFLSDLSEKIRSSAEQLRMIEQAVVLKTEDLKNLHDIEVAAVELAQLIENQKLQKEQFENLMADQRNHWEEEKAKRDQEQDQYLQTLRMEREKEEEEYRLQLAAEKDKARQDLAQELQVVHERNQANQEAMEKEFLKRELLLKEKELEWMQLAQELEQFISKLGRRAQTEPR